MANTYRVIVTPEARDQVKEIVDYWEDQESSTKAERTLDGILEAIDNLADMPTRHAPVPSISKRGTMYRRILSKPYRIVFTIDEQEITVTVVDIDHERRHPQIIIDKLG
jgi:plasmid stabilization system protein ParE